jgi:carbon-monoxide dehydrogenase small subunit
MADRKMGKIRQKPEKPECMTLTVNNQVHELGIGTRPGEVEPCHTLSHTLRETLGLTGTKVSCGEGACGACTVIMDGRAVLSCKILTIECNGKSITTIEGLKNPETGELDPLQQAFIDHQAFQCGFCTPGIIMTSKALLTENPSPTKEEVKEALSGNFCRCVSHYQVIQAVMSVAKAGHNG